MFYFLPAMKVIYRFFLTSAVLILVVCGSSTRAENHTKDVVLLTGEIFTPAVNYSGNAWYSSGWINGTVETINGVIYSGLQLQYNMLLDQLFWLSPNANRRVMLDKITIKSFKLEMEGGVIHRFQQIYLPDPVTGTLQGKFARVLFDQEQGVSLFGAYHKRFSSRSERVNRGGRTAHVRILTDNTSYYMQINDEDNMISVRPRNRSFINAFSGNKDSIRQILRDHNLRVRDEASLIQAVKLIDEFHR